MPFVRSARRAEQVGTAGLPWLPVHWFFTGLLIAASAGTVAYTGYLVRRLFTSEPPTDAAS